ncbi:hypothetical protein BGZ98_003462 [Dissophora globulifera]|nr:hypothetical protein BGZ98_003462 [Dissophora globulifera]
MEGRHGQKKQQAESTEVLKARQEREAVLVDSKKRDNDALRITTSLLRKSPDYYTIWNVRRTILQEGFLEGADAETGDKIYSNELEFVQENLKLNPKSYFMWNHRRWCLEHMSNPRWDKELAMVSKFLELDARNCKSSIPFEEANAINACKMMSSESQHWMAWIHVLNIVIDCFHGWDYRRYIIRQLDLQDKVSSDKILERAQSEFDYTTTKISQNFSNYSAWHNRSTLLGKLAEDMTEEERQATVDNEFDLVKNAIYTDPEDQSAWLYHLWLIGRVVAFDETVKFVNPPTVSTMVNHLPVPLAGEWKATGTDSTLGTIWIFQQAPGAEYGPTVELVIFEDDVCSFRLGARLHSAVCFELETVEKDLSKISGRLGRLVVGKNLMCDVTKRIGHVPDPDGTLDTQEENRKHTVTSLTTSDSLDDRTALLEREIAVVRELNEIEPDSKWPIQILSMLLSELRQTVRIHSTQAKLLDDECIELQEKLITIDPLRQERYEDRRTQLVFGRETLHLIKDGKRFPEVEFEEDLPPSLDLSMRGLTHIPISAYLVHLHTLNLDSNAITSTRFIRNLLNVRHVNLANNMIKRLEGLQHAPSLEILTLENNLIARWEDVVAGFMFWGEGKLGRTGGHVKVLLGNNPVVENEGGEYVLEKRWEDVGEVGLEIQWKSEELRLAEEALVAAEGVAGTSETHMEAIRRVSTTVVEFDAGPGTA